jgi:hypothetical protein
VAAVSKVLGLTFDHTKEILSVKKEIKRYIFDESTKKIT